MSHRLEGQTIAGNYEPNIKRQVLSPEEIRKMLEKKIEERNKILTSKRGDILMEHNTT